MSYLEGTIVSQANTPRSYIIEAQGHRYRHNRQHIKPVNICPPSPLARPYMQTAHQSHNNPIISGPPQPHQTTRNVQNMKKPTFNNAPHRPLIKSHKSIHQNCPYTRPHLTKPSNHLHKPISGPPQQDNLCPYKVLM